MNITKFHINPIYKLQIYKSMDSQGLCKHNLLVNTIQAIMIQIIMTITKF